MPATLVVFEIDRLADAGDGFVAGQVGGNEFVAGKPSSGRDRKNRRRQQHADMGIAGHFPVVELERVPGHRVGHGRVARGGAQAGAENRCVMTRVDQPCLQKPPVGPGRNLLPRSDQHAAVDIDECIPEQAEALHGRREPRLRDAFRDTLQCAADG